MILFFKVLVRCNPEVHVQFWLPVVRKDKLSLEKVQGRSSRPHLTCPNEEDFSSWPQ